MSDNIHKYIKYKKKYLELKNMDKLIFDNDIKFNSAGVIFIYNNNFVIFKSSFNDFCDVAGGGIDMKDNTIEETASRELLEESRLLFQIKSEILKNARDNKAFVYVKGRKIHRRRKAGSFACYVIEIDKLDTLVYNKNKETLKTIKLPHYYYETEDIKLIPIDNFNNLPNLNITKLTLSCMQKIIDDKIVPYKVNLDLIENGKFLSYIA
jgi:hypothetical protein